MRAIVWRLIPLRKISYARDCVEINPFEVTEVQISTTCTTHYVGGQVTFCLKFLDNHDRVKH
jgi:hypothetical protein